MKSHFILLSPVQDTNDALGGHVQAAGYPHVNYLSALSCWVNCHSIEMIIFRWPFFTYGFCKVAIKVFKTETIICLLPKEWEKNQWEEKNVYAEVTKISAHYNNVFWEGILIKILRQHAVKGALLTFSPLTMRKQYISVTMGMHTGKGRECRNLALCGFRYLPEAFEQSPLE